jgi:hypothetical protein
VYLVSGSVPKETLEQRYAGRILSGVPVDRDGIGVTNSDDQTTVQCFHEGKWIKLRGVAHDER